MKEGTFWLRSIYIRWELRSVGYLCWLTTSNFSTGLRNLDWLLTWMDPLWRKNCCRVFLFQFDVVFFTGLTISNVSQLRGEKRKNPSSGKVDNQSYCSRYKPSSVYSNTHSFRHYFGKVCCLFATPQIDGCFYRLLAHSGFLLIAVDLIRPAIF